MSTFSAVLLGDGPSAYFRLGEQSGTSAADAVGGTAGAYTGGFTIPTPGLIPTDLDGGVALNGTGYVSVAHRTALDLGDTFTIECLVKPTAYRDSGGLGGSLVDLGAQCPIVRFADALDGRFILRRNSVATLVTSTAAIPLNVVSHVAVTKSGATVKQYLNGVDVTGTVTNSTMSSNALPFVVGSADGGANNFLTGTIDEVAIYKTALTAAQVQQHAILALRARMLASAGAGA